jgi:hypothetical protein
MRWTVLALLAVVAVAGCNRRDVVFFDGMRFDSRLDASREDRRDFTVIVRGAAANVPAALQAGAYEATRHCLTTFGDSRVDWTAGPDQAPAQVALAADGSTILQGRCRAR